jgi:hypothetical protein
MTTGSPPSITDTTEFVVPRSIPITFAMRVPPAVLAHCKHDARKHAMLLGQEDHG